MPFVTQLPASVIRIDTSGNPVLSTNLNLLDLFTATQSVQFDLFDVSTDGAATVAPGDTLQPVTATGKAVAPAGTFIGGATFGTADFNLNLSDAELSVAVGDLSGHLYQGADGNVYFITDAPVGDANVNVTVTGTVLGDPLEPVTVPLSDLAGALPRDLGSTVQTAANGASVFLTESDTDPLVLSDDQTYDQVVCFGRGTLIETKRGPVPVEHLRAGDEVVTRGNGLQAVRWCGSVTVDHARMMRMPGLVPVRIRAGALGCGLPVQDLIVSQQHRVLVRSKIATRMFNSPEVLLAAKHLVGLKGIELASDLAEVEYFHFLCDDHQVVISNGAETETMFTGTEALKSVGAAAREEIFALFPELKDVDFRPMPARVLAAGHKSRMLVMRHAKHDRALVDAGAQA